MGLFRSGQQILRKLVEPWLEPVEPLMVALISDQHVVGARSQD